MASAFFFSTLFAPVKSWDNVRSTTAPDTESRLAHLVLNKCAGFPVVEHYQSFGPGCVVLQPPVSGSVFICMDPDPSSNKQKNL